MTVRQRQAKAGQKPDSHFIIYGGIQHEKESDRNRFYP